MRDRRAHIKVSRRFFEEDDWWTEPRRFSKAEAWLDCIQLASWKPRQFAIGLTVERLGRGEFMASLRYLGQRWWWSKSAVERFLGVLVKSGRLVRQREGQDGSVYLLVKYNYYQSSAAEDGTLDGTPTGTVAGQQRDKTEASKARKAEEATHGMAAPTTWLTPFADAWKARCGEPPIKRLARSLAPLRKQFGEPEAVSRWERYLAMNEPKYCSPERFAATHAAYAGPETCEMTDDLGRMVLHRKNGRGEWEIAG